MDIARGEMVEKELNAMIERRSRQKDPEEASEAWQESVRRYNARRREENRLAILNWQKSYSPRSDNRHVSTATEYVLVYARDLDRVALLRRLALMSLKGCV